MPMPSSFDRARHPAFGLASAGCRVGGFLLRVWGLGMFRV